MPPKRKSDDGTGCEQQQKKQCSGSSGASAAANRMSHAETLAAHALSQRKQISACSKLARLLSTADTRPLDQRAADVVALLQEDSQREQPLLNLSFQLDVS